jgi:hypothetical protein
MRKPLDRGVRTVLRSAFLPLWSAAAAYGSLAACSAPPPPETTRQERENALAKQRDCADPEWQRAHLGLWYDICRRNALR